MPLKTATTSQEVIDGYEKRHWRFLVDEQRASGTEFVIGRREGSYVWNLEGDRRVLDCGNSGGVHSLGHRNPEIIKALQDALEYLDAGLWIMPTAEHLELRDALAACAPSASISRSMATLSATNSIDLALMFSFRVTGRQRAAAFRYGYHGHGGLAALVTGSAIEGILGHYPVPEGHSAFFEEYGSLDSIADSIGNDCAAVILEPMNYETFQPAPPGYLAKVAELCHRRGALLIIDETRTGLSRSGRLWMTSHYDVEPDMLILGKGFGGGIYPASAVLTTDSIFDYCMNSGRWGYMSSMAISPIGAIVASKVLEIAQRTSVLKNVGLLESAFKSIFADLCATYPDVYFPTSVLGGIATLGLVNAASATTFKRELFKRNVLCHSVSAIAPFVVKFYPCLTSDPAIVGEVADALADIAQSQRR
ncbi:MAG: aminotransferase class III-fold pyridoxal phosphate-dependent enzyme [Terracidiphilus sp.]|jgi:acetylornithine aminotransferase